MQFWKVKLKKKFMCIEIGNKEKEHKIKKKWSKVQAVPQLCDSS